MLALTADSLVSSTKNLGLARLSLVLVLATRASRSFLTRVHWALLLIDWDFLDLPLLFCEFKLCLLLLLALYSFFDRLLEPRLCFTDFCLAFFRVEKLDYFLPLVFSQFRVLAKSLEGLHELHSGLLTHPDEGLVKGLEHPHEHCVVQLLAL